MIMIIMKCKRINQSKCSIIINSNTINTITFNKSQTIIVIIIIWEEVDIRIIFKICKIWEEWWEMIKEWTGLQICSSEIWILILEWIIKKIYKGLKDHHSNHKCQWDSINHIKVKDQDQIIKLDQEVKAYHRDQVDRNSIKISELEDSEMNINMKF